MALVSLSCVFSTFRSSVAAVLGGALGFRACAMGAGVFATGGAVLFAVCGARVVTLGLGPAASTGREVADGTDLTAGCGVRDALVARGEDGAICPRPAQPFKPTIAAAIIQICAADIIFPSPPILRGARSLSAPAVPPAFRRPSAPLVHVLLRCRTRIYSTGTHVPFIWPNKPVRSFISSSYRRARKSVQEMQL